MGSTVWKSSNKASYKLVYSDVFSHEGPCCTDDHDIDKISVKIFFYEKKNIIRFLQKKNLYLHLTEVQSMYQNRQAEWIIQW